MTYVNYIVSHKLPLNYSFITYLVLLAIGDWKVGPPSAQLKPKETTCFYLNRFTIKNHVCQTCCRDR